MMKFKYVKEPTLSSVAADGKGLVLEADPYSTYNLA
jgi:hypothetical protein